MKPSLLADGPMPPVTYILRSTTSCQILSRASSRPSVAGERGHVGHAAVEVHGPDGVAGHLGLLADRLVVLGVLAEQAALVRPAAHVEEELGQFQVTLARPSRGTA